VADQVVYSPHHGHRRQTEAVARRRRAGRRACRQGRRARRDRQGCEHRRAAGARDVDERPDGGREWRAVARRRM